MLIISALQRSSIAHTERPLPLTLAPLRCCCFLPAPAPLRLPRATLTLPCTSHTTDRHHRSTLPHPHPLSSSISNTTTPHPHTAPLTSLALCPSPLPPTHRPIVAQCRQWLVPRHHHAPLAQSLDLPATPLSNATVGQIHFASRPLRHGRDTPGGGQHHAGELHAATGLQRDEAGGGYEGWQLAR